MQAVILIYNQPAFVIDVYKLVSVDAGDTVVKVTLNDGRTITGYHIKFQMMWS